MLHLYSASRVEPLAAVLAEVLASPLEDPMSPDWVAVPTAGMRRWLALELARSLGASAPGAGDGIAANIEFTFPGALRGAVLTSQSDEGEADPWQVDCLVWAVLEVLRAGVGDEDLGPLTVLPPGATWYGRARRLADLLDRYAVRRPELLLAWSAGHDVDATGRPLAGHDIWQPHLWRRVRATVAVPSPPERMPGLLDKLRTGELSVALPARLAVFGVTTLPSGAPFIELIEALSVRRELHLLLLDPSRTATARVRRATTAGPGPLATLRSDDESDTAVSHPLLRSWGRPYRERTVLLAGAESRGLPVPLPVPDGDEAEDATATSLLARLQRDLRADRAPTGDFDLDPGDRSVQVHSCHGPARQVQVLRDAILHLLSDDPTLREEDIVVLCPAIGEFAALVEAGFGSSAEEAIPAPDSAPPRLSYRITDRSLRDSYPVVAALDLLLALVSGRFGASEVMEFIALPAVRRRFEFDADALRAIANWVDEANVRWGLDGAHREPWGFPPEFGANSWRAGLDRLLFGVAVSDDDLDLAPGGVAPLGVEGGDVAVAGRLADLIARLASLADDMRRPRTATQWCDALSDAIEQLFEVEASQQWQLDQLRRIVAGIADKAVVGGKPATVEISLADLRRLLAERTQASSRRPDFFRGGVTVTSLTPLRWLPFRVICLLGLDEIHTSAMAGAADGDDLAAAAPLVGDRDPRAEARQAILEAVLAAGDHLVITRTGHNIRTNQEVPNATVLAELRDAIIATLSRECRGNYRGQIETVHPLQRFDDRCFLPGLLNRPGPWSFDPGAFAGACARERRGGDGPALLEGPLVPRGDGDGAIELAELKTFFKNPPKAFWQQRLRLHLTDEDRVELDDLATSLDGLESWSVAERFLRARQGGHEDADWERHERALGTLPPGGLGDGSLEEIEGTVDAMLQLARELGVDPACDGRVRIDAELGDGTRVVGTVAVRNPEPLPGPVLVTYSKASPKQHIAAWLDLVALVATDPARDWHSVVVRRTEAGAADALVLVARGETTDARRDLARDGLEVAVDCYRRGLGEPIPLFACLSAKLYDGTAKPDDWQTRRGFGEGQDEANRLAFGDLDLKALRALPARPDDPPGTSPFRAQRFAEYLWDAIDESTEELT
ncbi:MAG: exodeoxyribonuclease V subunit gamma [Acidimicrobiales bacterium]